MAFLIKDSIQNEGILCVCVCVCVYIEYEWYTIRPGFLVLNEIIYESRFHHLEHFCLPSFLKSFYADFGYIGTQPFSNWQNQNQINEKIFTLVSLIWLSVHQRLISPCILLSRVQQRCTYKVPVIISS